MHHFYQLSDSISSSVIRSKGPSAHVSSIVVFLRSWLCSGLDPKARNDLWAVVREAKRTSSVLLTTHSMEEAEVRYVNALFWFFDWGRAYRQLHINSEVFFVTLPRIILLVWFRAGVV